jgi:hypothetical protein
MIITLLKLLITSSSLKKQSLHNLREWESRISGLI